MCFLFSNETHVLRVSAKQSPSGSEKNENNESGAALREMKGYDENSWGLQSRNSWLLICWTSNLLSNPSRTLGKTQKALYSTKHSAFRCMKSNKAYHKYKKCRLCCVLAAHFTCWINYAVNKGTSCYLLKTSREICPWRLTLLIICQSMSHIWARTTPHPTQNSTREFNTTFFPLHQTQVHWKL